MSAGLYIHIPFCRQKCSYCDFYSVPFTDDSGNDFREALNREIDCQSGSPPWSKTMFSTLYIGGGTPTILPAEHAVDILEACFDHFSFEGNLECTVEANPESVDEGKLGVLRGAGVNRLSLGCQSFSDEELRRLGRVHTVSTALSAYHSGRKAGFGTIGIDLIFALPGQTLDSWKNTLTKAVDLQPEHISTYNLTIEPGTPFAEEVSAGRITLLSEDEAADMYAFTIDFLGKNGYEQYEISNFARPGFRSKHNLIYWDHSPYLGLGPSAHSFSGNLRSENAGDVHEYIRCVNKGDSPVVHEERLSKEKLMAEFIFLSLRKREGADVSRFRETFDEDIRKRHGGTIEKYLDLKLLEWNGPFLRLTRDGMMLANTVCAEFI